MTVTPVYCSPLRKVHSSTLQASHTSHLHLSHAYPPASCSPPFPPLRPALSHAAGGRSHLTPPTLHHAPTPLPSGLLCHMLLVGGRSPNKILYAKDTGRVMQTDFMPVYNEKALLEKVEQVRGGRGGGGMGSRREGGEGEEGEGREEVEHVRGGKGGMDKLEQVRGRRGREEEGQEEGVITCA